MVAEDVSCICIFENVDFQVILRILFFPKVPALLFIFFFFLRKGLCITLVDLELTL